MKIVANLGLTYSDRKQQIKQKFGVSDDDIIVLALKRDAEPFRSKTTGNQEAPLLEKASGSKVVFIDEEGFNPTNLGQEIEEAIIVLNGGTSKSNFASFKIYQGLWSGMLVDLQRDLMEVYEQKDSIGYCI